MNLVFHESLRLYMKVYLVRMLDRRNVDLLVLCVTFLKKLSIYKVWVGVSLTPD